MDEELPDDLGDRTEEPTERRRQELRRKGQVPRSHDLTTAAHLLALALGLWMFGLPMFRSLGQFLRGRLEQAPRSDYDTAFVVDDLRSILEFAAVHFLPMMLFAAVAALGVSLFQVGFLWVPELLSFKWSHLNPVAGAQRIFSFQGVVRLAASLAKLAAVGAVAAWMIMDDLPLFVPTTEADPGALVGQLDASMARLALVLAVTLVALALADYGVQWWQFERGIKMTRQEIVDEFKESEGDPKFRGAHREARQKLLKARDVQKTRTADAVVTNPLEIAIAIKYDPKTMPAPIVVAKGKGEVAAMIRRIAIECGIPIIERRPLAQALYKMVKVGQAIPVEMYDVFVEIMKYVYEITGRVPPELAE